MDFMDEEEEKHDGKTKGRKTERMNYLRPKKMLKKKRSKQNN